MTGRRDPWRRGGARLWRPVRKRRIPQAKSLPFAAQTPDNYERSAQDASAQDAPKRKDASTQEGANTTRATQERQDAQGARRKMRGEDALRRNAREEKSEGARVAVRLSGTPDAGRER